MAMVITSFAFVGVFAEDPPTEPPAPTVEAPEPVEGLHAYSSLNGIVLLWDIPAEDKKPDGYLVNGKDVGIPDTYKGKYRADIGGLEEGQGIAGTVIAYNLDGEEKVPSKSKSDGNYAVQTIRYRVKIKKSGTLKAHGGRGPSSTYVRKGEFVDCYGFGGGKYIFERDGSIFYCNKSRTSKRTCVYNSGRTYNNLEAEFFVNAKNISSSTNRLVWVNTYTQTLYMFEGSRGNWHCVLYDKCSTGKAASPTPTGVSGQKTIWKKIAKRHGIKYWSPFSEINSIHSKKSKWKMGAPKSNGCVRNYINNAYKVYTECPIGTTVLIY